ncbi:MAG: hypothetical protein K6A40_05095 [Solobacterium sp.]|nr:hypothetical protein [Solobacterium sp.]
MGNIMINAGAALLVLAAGLTIYFKKTKPVYQPQNIVSDPVRTPEKQEMQTAETPETTLMEEHQPAPETTLMENDYYTSETTVLDAGDTEKGETR